MVMPTLIANETRCRHQERRSSYRLKRARRNHCPPLDAGLPSATLIAIDEAQPHACYFDDIAVIQAHRPGNWRSIHARHFVARSKIVPVVALIDLRRHRRLEPSL